MEGIVQYHLTLINQAVEVNISFQVNLTIRKTRKAKPRTDSTGEGAREYPGGRRPLVLHSFPLDINILRY